MQQKPTFDHSRAWHSEKHSLLVPRKHIHVRLAYVILDGITHLNTHVPYTSALYIFLLALQIVDALLVLSLFHVMPASGIGAIHIEASIEAFRLPSFSLPNRE